MNVDLMVSRKGVLSSWVNSRDEVNSTTRIDIIKDFHFGLMNLNTRIKKIT